MKGCYVYCTDHCLVAYQKKCLKTRKRGVYISDLEKEEWNLEGIDQRRLG